MSMNLSNRLCYACFFFQLPMPPSRPPPRVDPFGTIRMRILSPLEIMHRRDMGSLARLTHTSYSRWIFIIIICMHRFSVMDASTKMSRNRTGASKDPRYMYEDPYYVTYVRLLAFPPSHSRFSHTTRGMKVTALRLLLFSLFSIQICLVMGNVMRMARYDRAANVAAAIPSPLTLGETQLGGWHRLDDGVMGGRSETAHAAIEVAGRPGIHFAGTINTNGGGFASIRAPFEAGGLSGDTPSLRIKFRGDGRTYKVLLSDGGSSGPMGGSPSWQVDLPTKKLGPEDEAQIATLPLESFVPSFGGRAALKKGERSKFQFHASEMKQLGLMLSLRLSDGSPNPKETFGEGEFDFSLFVESIETSGGGTNEKEGDEKPKSEL